MKELEWINVLMNIASRKMRLAIEKLCEDSKKEPLIVNDKELLSMAESLLDKKKINGNQRAIWARAMFVHKNAYKYAYEKQYGEMMLIDSDDENTNDEVNKFVDFVINSSLYEKK